MNCHELAKPGSTVSGCMYVLMQAIQFYPGSIRFEREPRSTGFNPVYSADMPLYSRLPMLFFIATCTSSNSLMSFGITEVAGGACICGQHLLTLIWLTYKYRHMLCSRPFYIIMIHSSCVTYSRHMGHCHNQCRMCSSKI